MHILLSLIQDAYFVVFIQRSVMFEKLCCV